MPQINLVSYRLLKWIARGELPIGLYQFSYDSKENGRKIITPNLWESDIVYECICYKEENNKDNSIEILIKGNFIVANIDNTSEKEINNLCVRILIDKLQELVDNISETDDATKVDVTPPKEFFN